MPAVDRRIVRAALLALVFWALSLSGASTVVAQTPPAPPPLTAAVNDFANVIDADSKRELERRMLVLQQATGDVIIVATVPTFQPFGDVTQYAVEMFENGGKGIGQPGKDNGLLVVVAVEDRKVGIETGYGLEPFITDGFAGQTIRESILPAFRSGQYGAGLVAGVTRIVNRIAEQRGVTLADVPQSQPRARPRSTGVPVSTIVSIIVILWFISRASGGGRGGRRRGRGSWSGWSSGVGPFGAGGGFGGGFGGFGGGGGGGGGFGGFGGGRSGGGGAAGGW